MPPLGDRARQLLLVRVYIVARCRCATRCLYTWILSPSVGARGHVPWDFPQTTSAIDAHSFVSFLRRLLSSRPTRCDQRSCIAMVGQQTNQALRLLMVALALSATLPRTAADAVTSLGSTTMAATLALSSAPVGTLQVTKLAGGSSGTCGVTATVQLGDTVDSIMCGCVCMSSLVWHRHVLCGRHSGTNV